MQESKSTFNTGHRFEIWAFEYLKPKFTLIGHNVKSKYAEIDLVVRDQNYRYHLVEVKSSGLGIVYQPRVSNKQANRLFQAQEYLNEFYSVSLRTHLMVVQSSDDIQIYRDFLVDLL